MRRRNEQNDQGLRGRNGGRGYNDYDYDRNYPDEGPIQRHWSRNQGTGSDFGRQGQFRFNEGREDRWSRPTNFERYDRVNREGRRERLENQFDRNTRGGREDDLSYDFSNADYSGYNPREERGGFFGKGPKGWKRSPERIRDEVCEILWRNPRVDASEIEVTVEDNCVCLRGSVEDRQAKREAESAIEHLSGVEDVRNELRIKREAGTSEANRESNLRGIGKAANLS